MAFKQVQKKGNGNQLVQNVAKMLQQGQDPKQVLQLLVKNGVPQKQAIQLVQGVMQQMQGQHQESPQQEQQEPTSQQSPQEEQAEMKMGGYKRMQMGGSPRLVDKVPDGYIPMDKPNYYHNPQQTASLKPAQATTNQGGAGYDQFLQKAATQYPIDELVRKGYGTQQGLSKYQGMYKPSDDIVFTQAQVQPTAPVQPQPTPQWASRNQYAYTPDHHIAAEILYPTRDSQNQTQGGTLNTAQSAAKLRFRNDNGYTGEEIELAGPDMQKYLGTTNTFPTGDLFNELKGRAKAPIASKKRGGMIKGKISKSTMTNPYC